MHEFTIAQSYMFFDGENWLCTSCEFRCIDKRSAGLHYNAEYINWR